MRQLETDLRSRKPRFVLTPLIDVIFLLLVFFMLSSQIAPYGLLVLSGSSGNGAPGAAATAEPPVTLRVSHGRVSAGDRTIAIDDMPDAVLAMKAAGIAAAVIITTRSATIQDVVSVLQAFKAAEFANVTLLNRLERQ